ncbi:hypothetical protein M405DRAFT_855633 [Rhizopogon salebrosus TDB-379]|nr:hypothetical protein M405DRAFT_855633 [Rhizopogon salebrosus TDB-379]
MPDCILLHSGQLYSVSLDVDCACGPNVNGDLGQVPKSVEQASQGKRAKIVKRSLEKTTVAPGESIERVVQKKAIATSGDTVAISTNDFYDLSILQDYGGEVFRHENASLRQLDFRDVDNELIHPKDWYSVLRRGTLIMARGTLHAYNWEGRRVYQLSAQTIRVLKHSSMPMEPVAKVHNDQEVDAGSSDSAAAHAIASIQLGKRARE